MTTKAPTKTVNMSAKTGQFVTKQYEKTHPATTMKVTVPVVKPGKGK